MARKFLDYLGLQTFKKNLNVETKKTIKDILGLKDSEEKLSYASDEDVDKGVIKGEEVGDGVIRLKNFAHYHNVIKADIVNPEGDLNAAVQTAIADALEVTTDENGNEVKSDVYEKVEGIIDEKMKWKSEFPE